MKIHINKEEKGIIQYNIDEGIYKTLNFENLVELSNSFITQKLTSKEVEIEGDSSNDLYKKTIIDILASIDEDDELKELLNNDSDIEKVEEKI